MSREEDDNIVRSSGSDVTEPVVRSSGSDEEEYDDDDDGSSVSDEENLTVALLEKFKSKADISRILAEIAATATAASSFDDDDDDDVTGNGTPLKPGELWSNVQVKQAAQLALDDHEKKTCQKLELKELVSGEYTIVDGDLFDLNLRVTDENGKPYIYQTRIYICEDLNIQDITGKLTSDACEQKAAGQLTSDACGQKAAGQV